MSRAVQEARVPKRITPDQKRMLWADVKAGWDPRTAASRNHMAYSTARAILKGLNGDGAVEYRQRQEEKKWPDPIHPDNLGAEARKALEDIAFFSERYFGILLMPWQLEAAAQMRELLATNYEEFVVVNAPPGGGKTTFFTRIVPAWMTCRDRQIRGMIGSATGSRARRYTRALRNEFQRVVPVKAKREDLKQGTAKDAVATLAGDYGTFRPLTPDMWREEAFVVALPGDLVSGDKEPTWEAFGLDETYLGGRYTFVIWDDLWDPKKTRSLETRERIKQDYSEVTEARLEPGGLFVLQGQRISSDDIYRYALDMRRGEDDNYTPLYHHIKFKAHYPDRCKGDHGRNAEPYPGGCLLAPRRLSWRSLSAKMENRGSSFEVIYQQEDVDPADVLVPMLWITGGRDRNGFEWPGCWDHDRDLRELSPGISGDLVSVATADPSPTQNWAIQWWIYHPDSEQHFLMDTRKGKLEAPEFFDYNPTTRELTGVMVDWQEQSMKLGWPIETWVVEANVAQRWLLQGGAIDLFRRRYGVDIIGHQTNKNKADPEYGVETIAPHFQHGRVRLPKKQFTDKGGRSLAGPTSMRLVDEITKYTGIGGEAKDDQVMACWFYFYNLEKLYNPTANNPPRTWRPTWLRGRSAA